jgi:serine/threonine protein kinase/tetratricopeptide (TPR) repeat protein
MIGQTISHYRILDRLGEGGMGVVYLAEDIRLERKVAMKFLPRHYVSDERGRKRFEIEAKAAAALNHPNISTIYGIEHVDSEQWGQETCIVMEYIEGRELSEIIEEIPTTPLPETTIRLYAIQIARGLAAAHARGIIHRDIKSRNIMITPDGHVKIMDFGLAKIHGGEQVTKSGTTVGTAAYMSPEQIQGKEVDRRSDIWSLGVILFEMMTGTRPFSGAYEQSLFYMIINEEPAPVLPLSDNPSSALVHVVKKCLQKNPAHRYQSASELLQDLLSPSVELLLGSASTVGSEKTVVSTLRKNRPSRTWVAAAIISLAVLAVLALFPGRHLVESWFNGSAVPAEQHVLVLPFTNVGGDAGNQPFCDGLMETLTSKLTQLEQFNQSLWVVPASEVRRNNVRSASEAHSSFGANLVITGSLQLLGDIFRLSLNLVDAKNLRQLNSTVIDVKETNLATLQNESVSRLLDMLNRELNPRVREVIEAGGTTVPGAYEYYVQGLGYLQRYEDEKNLDAAITVLRHAIVQDSLYVLAYAGLAEAYWRKYEAVKENHWVAVAMEESEKAYRLNSQLPEVNITRGMIHGGTGQHDKAVTDFRRALDVDVTNASAYRGLAKAYEEKGLLDQAEITFQRSISLKPDYWAGYNDLGVFYFRHNRYEDAIKQFRQVVSLTPDNDRGFSNLGGIYYLLKRWPEAQEMFERALALRKTYRVCSNLGTLYYIQGEYTRAARMYETALELNDNDYRVWGNLAAAYYWAPGERQNAQKTYRRAIELGERSKQVNTQDPGLFSRLGGYYSMIGEREVALSHMHQAVSLAPEDAEVMFRVGAAYEQLGERHEALRWIGEALRNGYPMAEIENQPELRELLKDKRFPRQVSTDSSARPGVH